MNSIIPTLDDKTQTPTVRLVSAEHVAWFDEQLRDHHYLGAGRPVGDYLRQIVFAQHEDGAPQSVAIYDQKENTPRCEQAAAQALLENLPSLDNKTVTADALHCQKPIASTIVAKGGECLLQIKANQPNLLK